MFHQYMNQHITINCIRQWTHIIVDWIRSVLNCEEPVLFKIQYQASKSTVYNTECPANSVMTLIVNVDKGFPYLIPLLLIYVIYDFTYDENYFVDLICLLEQNLWRFFGIGVMDH